MLNKDGYFDVSVYSDRILRNSDTKDVEIGMKLCHIFGRTKGSL